VRPPEAARGRSRRRDALSRPGPHTRPVARDEVRPRSASTMRATVSRGIPTKACPATRSDEPVARTPQMRGSMRSRTSANASAPSSTWCTIDREQSSVPIRHSRAARAAGDEPAESVIDPAPITSAARPHRLEMSSKNIGVVCLSRRQSCAEERYEQSHAPGIGAYCEQRSRPG
jgi:hypothetical protein